MDLSCMRWSGGRGYVVAGVLKYRAPEKKRGRWRVMWRKVKKIRIIMLNWSCRAREMQMGYDRESYLKNFDEGCMMMMAAMGEEADAISRSFSARFAISNPHLP